VKVHLVDIENLPSFRNTVVTIGSFDGVHNGHKCLLNQIRQLATEHNLVTVVISFEPHPRLFLEPQSSASVSLLSTAIEKEQLIAETGIDHLVFVRFDKKFSTLSPNDYIANFLVGGFDPRFVVVGYDHRYGADRSGDTSLLKKLGLAHNFQVVEINPQSIDEIIVSSTKIRNAIRNGDLGLVHELLGHRYLIKNKVIRGDQIGRTLGFPTANLQVDVHKLLPPDGIYLTDVVLEDGRRYKGMLYIGNRPTLNNEPEKRVEVYILDFSEDIYDQYLQLDVLANIRGDKTFNSLEELRLQIEKDIQDAHNILITH
jgi:riboflavin kinase/FMN adenylyltransferase